jgi:uncharacterized protein (DUF111 family)
LVEQPNILRLFWGTTSDTHTSDPVSDLIWQLETNVDDVPAEVLGYTSEKLFDLGALDVFYVPVQMKKNRPGVMIVVLCGDEVRGPIEEVLFRETGTLGIRRCRKERSKLLRQIVHVPTPWGPIAGKVAWNDSVKVFTPEYEDCARVARQEAIPLRTVFESARRAFEQPG